MRKQTRFNKNAEWKLEPYENNVIKPLRDYCDPLSMKKPKLLSVKGEFSILISRLRC